MGTKILVIEDADALRKDIMEMLSFEDYDVEGANNGVNGVNLARSWHPDLIICDIMMPELDGYGVLAELRRDGAGLTIPFIFLTAKTDKSDMRLGMDLGADDYLTKPFTAQELINCVRKRLEKVTELNRISEEKLDELRENIILALPHELRTPLTGILGFADILMMDSNDMSGDKIAEMARYIHSAAQRLYRLTENYVVYAQLEVLKSDNPRAELLSQFATGEVRSLVENVAFQQAQYYRREADLELSIDDNAAIKMIDENLKKVVLELLDNAFKFSAPGRPVSVEGVFQDDHYTLTIMDHGRGMSEQQLTRIGAFMQFNRKLYEQQGSGFGLAIVQRSVELHHGTFKLESMPDQYTRVTVILPAVPALEYGIG